MKEYKASPWGIIPTHWKISSIKEETDVVTDYVANGSFASLAENVKYKSEKDYAVLIRLVDYNNQFKGDFVYIDKNAYEFLGKSKLYGDEIIISNVGANVGTVFRCPHLGCKMSLAPNSIMVKFNGNNDFYYYWLKSRFGQHMLKSIVTGSAQPKFNKTNFRDLQIPVPPLDEQESIASILKSLDDKIEVNRRINDNLEQQAQALFKSWFVDFEPFKEGEFVESELGMIPKGWKVYCLSDFLPVITGKKDANVAKGGPYPFFSCSQDFGWTDNYSFEGCAILVAGNGDFNVKMYSGRFEAYQRTYVLIPYNPHFAAWLYYAVKYHLNYITSAARGSVIKFITKGNLADFMFPAPSNLEKVKIIEALDSIRINISSIEDESRRLAELRDTLLPRLMSGEIKVGDVTL